MEKLLKMGLKLCNLVKKVVGDCSIVLSHINDTCIIRKVDTLIIFLLVKTHQE